MLTQSERAWLSSRKGKDDLYLFCKHCTVSPKTDDCYWNHVVGACPMYPDIEDAAAFSERVAAKLADAYWPPLVYTPVAPFEQLFMPPMDRLKWARIEVEEEMDNGA